MSAARLSVTEGKERGREIPLKRGPVVLGRSEQADFMIEDDRMSRHHARISSQGGRWTIEDLGSANGTRVNGVGVKQSTPLRHGDEIGLGDSTMRFELLDDSPPAPAPIPAPARAPSAAPAPAARSDSDGGLVGRTIGGYEILAELGRGAVGVVYRARQTSLKREVALKVLAPKFAADPAFLRRFVDESAAAARLSHPNVVQVYDAGNDQGLFFYSMELMRGGSLDRKLATLKGERFSVHAALSAVLDAARGMQFSESCGIIHRDIKPDNLMVAENGAVKIGDLGIAVEAGDADVKRMGTPAYLAPEVVNGEPPSAASDIYGLGATLYRMLAGRTPYEAVGAADTLRRVREGPPPRIDTVAPNLPPEVVDLVGWMMARKPQDRPKSAREIVETIERMRLDREVKKATKAAGRSPMVVAAYVVVIGGGIGAAALYALRSSSEPETPPAPPPTAVAKQTEHAAETDPATARAREAIAALIAKETALGAVELARKDEWRALVAEYDAFASKFPDAERQRATAEKRSAFIKDALGKLEESDRKLNDEATRAWKERRAKLDSLEGAEQWTDAIELASATTSDTAFARTFDRVDGSRQYLLQTRERVQAAVRKSLDSASKSARALLDKHDLAGAIDVMTQWAAKTRLHSKADPKIEAAVREADAFAAKAKSDEARRVADTLTSDVEAMTAAMTGSAVCRGDKLALRFADARAALTNLLPNAKTGLVKKRVERRIARLDAAESGWKGFVERFGRGEVVADGSVVFWAPGVPQGATAKLALGRKPTTDGFAIDFLMSGASVHKTVAWADVPVGVVSSNLFAPAVGKFTGADAAAFMWFCIELRQPLVASDSLSRAGLSADEAAQARFEIDAVRDWAKATAAGGASADLGPWRAKYASSDARLTIDVAEKPTAEESFGEAAVKAYMDSGGAEPR